MAIRAEHPVFKLINYSGAQLLTGPLDLGHICLLGYLMRHWGRTRILANYPLIGKNDLILIMIPEKQDKTLELSKHWSADSTPARNEVIMKRTFQ